MIEEITMPHYMLSVHSVAGDRGEPMTDEQMKQSFEQLAILEQEMRSTGTWVFSGRLHEPDTATVVRISGGEVVTTDGPFVESKEHLGDEDHSSGRHADRSLAVRRCPDLTRVVGPEPMIEENTVGRIFREESGRSVAALIRAFRDIDIAEDAVQEAFAVAAHTWQAEGLPPNAG